MTQNTTVGKSYMQRGSASIADKPFPFYQFSAFFYLTQNTLRGLREMIKTLGDLFWVLLSLSRTFLNNAITIVMVPLICIKSLLRSKK